VTGIVSTSEIQNATPASYSSHVTRRDNADDIAEQQVYANLDVVLGGGKHALLRKNRADREDLVSVIRKLGYEFVETKDELAAARGRADKIWGSFAPMGMSNHFDRAALAPEQPTLAEMTEAALDVLSKKKKGFFLFVEGSKVDWAAHKNDPVGMVSEVLGFDEAVAKALEFARADGNTLVIALADHANSGLSIGSSATDRTYMNSAPELFVEPLKKARLTLEGALAALKPDRSNLRECAAKYGLGDLSRAEWRRLRKAKNLEEEMSRMLSRKAKLGFTTHGHTGEDVFLYAFGPGKPTGLIDNTDVARVISDYLGLGLATKDGTGALYGGGPDEIATKDRTRAIYGASHQQRDELATKDKSGRLSGNPANRSTLKYVPAERFFKEKGYRVKLCGKKSANPVFVAEGNGVVLKFPENKNYFLKNGVKVETWAPTVFNGTEFFVATE
jgi:alkaline phosphatase